MSSPIFMLTPCDRDENSIHFRIRNVDVDSSLIVDGLLAVCLNPDGDVSFRVRDGLGRVNGGHTGVAWVVIFSGQGLVKMSREYSPADARGVPWCMSIGISFCIRYPKLPVGVSYASVLSRMTGAFRSSWTFGSNVCMTASGFHSQD
jgi:hypothetical protein